MHRIIVYSLSVTSIADWFTLLTKLNGHLFFTKTFNHSHLLVFLGGAPQTHLRVLLRPALASVEVTMLGLFDFAKTFRSVTSSIRREF